MKYFICSDIHSFYDEWQKALIDNGFDYNNPEHSIIVLGDLCDRGYKPKECIEFALDMYSKGRAILISGNHEDLMEEAIARHEFGAHDYHNCTVETARALTGYSITDIFDGNDSQILKDMRHNELWNSYVSKLVNYAELGDNIFVHGWLPTAFKSSTDDKYKDLPELYRPVEESFKSNWRDSTDEQWRDAKWLNGMSYWNRGIREPGKTIWCGHYHSSWGNSRLHNDGKEWLSDIETYYIDPDTGKQEPHVNHGPFIDAGIVCLDACTAISGFVNCKVLEI